MKSHEPETAQVAGERAAAVVHKTRGIQARLNSILAFGLMSALGLGTLTWYYAEAFARQGRARQTAEAVTTSHAQGDMRLPALGPVDPSPVSESQAAQPPAPPQQPLPGGSLPTLAEAPPPFGPGTGTYRAGGSGEPPVKNAAALALERQLGGSVYAAQPATGVDTSPADGSSPAPQAPAISPQAVAAAGDPLSGLMQSLDLVGVRAQVLPTLRLLLPKGAFIDCTLETAIDSTLPGLTTCITATDTFGADGKVVLLERGTKLIGEIRGQLQQGMARVFVLWTEARTPEGVVVPLASPGTDPLGRSGLPGAVNRHFWQRFGAAMLVSVIDGGLQAAVQSANSGGGTVVVNPSSAQGVMTEVLKDTISIPPTIVKRQGERIQVLVARNLDFRSVYELRVAAGRR